MVAKACLNQYSARMKTMITGAHFRRFRRKCFQMVIVRYDWLWFWNSNNKEYVMVVCNEVQYVIQKSIFRREKMRRTGRNTIQVGKYFQKQKYSYKNTLKSIWDLAHLIVCSKSQSWPTSVSPNPGDPSCTSRNMRRIVFDVPDTTRIFVHRRQSDLSPLVFKCAVFVELTLRKNGKMPRIFFGHLDILSEGRKENCFILSSNFLVFSVCCEIMERVVSADCSKTNLIVLNSARW